MSDVDGGLKIRKAEPEDASILAELAGQLGYAATADAIHERLARIKRIESQAVFVACLPSEVIGWIDVAITLHLQSEPFALIGGLVVKNGYRGMQVGQRLCQAAEEWARRRGVDRMRVTSRSTRSDAHRFYLRDGYAEVKTSRVFEKRL